MSCAARLRWLPAWRCPPPGAAAALGGEVIAPAALAAVVHLTRRKVTDERLAQQLQPLDRLGRLAQRADDLRAAQQAGPLTALLETHGIPHPRSCAGIACRSSRGPGDWPAAGWSRLSGGPHAMTTGSAWRMGVRLVRETLPPAPTRGWPGNSATSYDDRRPPGLSPARPRTRAPPHAAWRFAPGIVAHSLLSVVRSFCAAWAQ